MEEVEVAFREAMNGFVGMIASLVKAGADEDQITSMLIAQIPPDQLKHSFGLMLGAPNVSGN